MSARIWFFKPTSTTWTDVRIYRSSAYSGTYTLLATQALTSDPEQYYDDASGSSNYYYKVSFWDGVNETTLSDGVRGGDYGYYTNPERIKSYLQLPNSFSSSTRPTDAEVVDLIEEICDDIDRSTSHAWRMAFAYDPEDSNDYEYHDLKGRYEYLTGLAIYLNHRKIKSLDSGSGDVLQVWNGSSWEDWLTAKTEGRGNDFWMDYANGVLYIRTSLSLFPIVKGLRIRCRYGDETVPNNIRLLATKMVAVHVMGYEDYSALFPEGGEGDPIGSKIRREEDSIANLTAKFTEFKTL